MQAHPGFKILNKPPPMKILVRKSFNSALSNVEQHGEQNFGKKYFCFFVAKCTLIIVSKYYMQSFTKVHFTK